MQNYQQIDMKISPKLIPAKLTSRSVCSCGSDAFEPGIPVGKEYNCDLDSIRWARWQCYECGKVTEVRIIDVYSNMPFVPIQWFVLDILDLAAGIPATEKPASWEKVQHNKIPPKAATHVRIRKH